MGVCKLQLIIFVLGLGYGVLAQEDIRQPPNIEEPTDPETKFFVGKTNPQPIKCKASGKPTPKYQWWFGEKPVTAQNPPGDRVTYNDITGDLTIKNITEAQTGVYQCRAYNKYATALAPRTTVQLSKLESWPTNNPQRGPVNIIAGNYGSIKCDPYLPARTGINNFKWYLRSDAENVEVLPDDRIFIDNEGTLHFTYAILKDAESNMPYSCALSNLESGSIVMGTKISLNVFTPEVAQTKPELRYKSVADRIRGTPLVRGKEGRLECFFSGRPSPTVSWEDKAGNPIKSEGNYKTTNDGRILIIKDVQMEKGTTFKCIGNNSEGTASATIQVDITSAPMWIKGEKLVSQTVPEVQNVVFHCGTESLRDEPAPSPPQWYRNGDEMDPQGSSKYRFTKGRKELTVMDVTKENDIACYQCEVKNHVGELFGQGCLNVILPINITTRPPEEMEVTRGDLINLTVTATSDHLYPVTYEWLFRNSTYVEKQAPPHVVYDSRSLVAYINTSKLSAEELKNITGVYRRLVYHQYQRKEVYVTVKLKVPPGPAVAGFPFWIIGLIIALLIILIILIICCCVICRRKMQEGDYPVDKKETAAGLDPEKEVEESKFPDLSRAQDPYHQKKPGQFDMDGHSIRDDESFGSAEYGGDEPSAFNEDGSFIGAYKSKDKQPVVNPGFQPAAPPPAHYNYPYDSGNESRV